MSESAPIIMTAEMGDADFAWANALRRRHFPPERNYLDAHVTLFHHLPPGHLAEAKERVKRLTAEFAPPEATLDSVMQLGRGVAYRIRSPGLLALREELAAQFHGLLTPQDQATRRLHVTVQNKVEPAEAKGLYRELAASFEPRPFALVGLALHRYLGGPWEKIGGWRFRGRERL